MTEQRLIDANDLYGVESLLNTDIVQKSETASWLMGQVLHDINASPTIDPKDLPIVQQLREELARVTAERDALLNQGIWTTSKFGALTMDNDVARAFFGHAKSKEARP